MADPKTAAEWFVEADQLFRKAVQRVMTASVCTAPLYVERRCDWTAFRYEMARLQEYAELRHAAKHASMLEAMYSCGPVTIATDPSGDT